MSSELLARLRRHTKRPNADALKILSAYNIGGCSHAVRPATCHCSLFPSLPTYGQLTSGIDGTTRTPLESPIPGATVTVTDITRRVKRSVTSNQAEYFRIDNMAASAYRVQITMSSFKTWRESGLTIQAGEVGTIAPTLEPGEISATVDVASTEEPLILLAQLLTRWSQLWVCHVKPAHVLRAYIAGDLYLAEKPLDVDSTDNSLQTTPPNARVLELIILRSSEAVRIMTSGNNFLSTGSGLCQTFRQAAGKGIAWAGRAWAGLQFCIRAIRFSVYAGAPFPQGDYNADGYNFDVPLPQRWVNYLARSIQRAIVERLIARLCPSCPAAEPRGQFGQDHLGSAWLLQYRSQCCEAVLRRVW
jgi:Carboxypeptidase regulatory-like domain